VLGDQLLDHAGRDRFLADVEVQEAADLLLLVELAAALLHASDAQHRAVELQRAQLVGQLGHPPVSSVEVSPRGRPSSCALSRRRMILPLLVLGRSSRNASSRGATAGPSSLRAWARMSRSSAASAVRPRFSATKAL